MAARSQKKDSLSLCCRAPVYQVSLAAGAGGVRATRMSQAVLAQPGMLLCSRQGVCRRGMGTWLPAEACSPRLDCLQAREESSDAEEPGGGSTAQG